MRRTVVHVGREPVLIDRARVVFTAGISWGRENPPRHAVRSGYRVILLFCLMIVAPGLGCDQRADAPSKPARVERQAVAEAGGKVLVVHSYHPEYEWVAGISRGVHRAFETTDVELETFYMDTKRRTDQAWKEASGQEALRTIKAWNPDVVIAVDDNAQQFFARHLIGRARPQVVFCGVNGDPADYGYPASNVTGILERPHLSETITLLREIVPGIQRIAVLTDDSPTSVGAMEFFRTEECPAEIVARSMVGDFAEWQREIRSFQARADAVLIYMYHTIKGSEGDRSMDPREVVAWTMANSRIPLAGMFSFSIDDGMLCGVAGSAVEHGLEAGRLGREVLAGVRPSEIPVITAVEGHRMLNLDTARLLGIEVSQELLDSLDVVVGETDGA